MLETFTENHWIQQETFERIFDYLLRNVVSLVSLDGQSDLKESYYPNEITGYDQSAPQHYDSQPHCLIGQMTHSSRYILR